MARFGSSISYNNINLGKISIYHELFVSGENSFSAKLYFPGACYTCGAMSSVTGVRVQYCSGCQLVSYCDKNCQRADWNEHKLVCKKFPVEMGKNVIVRKIESIEGPLQVYSFQHAMVEMVESVIKNEDPLNKYTSYTYGVENIFLNARTCVVCRKARREMLFDCRCCSASYCSEEHRMIDKKHLRRDCDVLYGLAMANWYLIKHRILQIPDGLLNEGSIHDGLSFQKVSKLAEYSHENWLEAIVTLINERLTFPRTLHDAIKNLKLGEQSKSLSEITSLTIHIVHSTPMLDPRIWEFMLHQLPNLKTLNLTFINSNIKLHNQYNEFIPVERCCNCKKEQRVINYNIQHMYYHKYFSSEDYVQPDVVAVFNTYNEFIGRTSQDIDRAECVKSQEKMTYSNHTVVILTDCVRDRLEECVKSFNDARPVKIILPVQENQPAWYTPVRADSTFGHVNQYLCCILGNH